MFVNKKTLSGEYIDSTQATESVRDGVIKIKDLVQV